VLPSAFALNLGALHLQKKLGIPVVLGMKSVGSFSLHKNFLTAPK